MWFSDNPWPPMTIFALAAVVFFAMGLSQSRKSYLVIAFLLSVACVGTFFVEQWIITDEELVEAQVYELTDAFYQLDIDGALELFSQGAKNERALVQQMGSFIEQFNSLRITDTDVELLANDSRAKTHFRANGELTAHAGGKHRFSSRWELIWQKEGGEWKVIKVQRLHPITGEHISSLSAQ